MVQTVYADLLFLIDFGMDFLCLYLVGVILSRRFSLPRALLAAAIGGIYSVASLFFVPRGVFGVIIDIGVSLLMCLAAFAGKNESFPAVTGITVCYIFSSMLLGGIMTAVFSLMNRLSLPMPEAGNEEGIPLPILLPVGLLCTLLTFFGGRLLLRRARGRSVTLTVTFSGCRIVLDALCDTGNLLRDPMDGKPVVLIDERMAVRLLPPLCPSPKSWNIGTLSSLPPEVASRLRVIPVTTVNSDSLVYALRPDSITVGEKNDVHPANALVAFVPLDGTRDGFRALVPAALLS